MPYFENKVIWITGASSGIGRELAIQFAKKGALLILSARNSDELHTLKTSLKNSSNHLIIQLDLSNNNHFDTIASEVYQHFGQIDILINNGGVSQRGEASKTPMETVREIMEINFFGNIALAKAVLPYFQQQKSGHFVVTSSIAGKFGFYLRSSYSASKHALHGYYESLALEESKNGIAVSLIVPGKINTPISLRAINEEGKAHGKMDRNQESGMSVEICAQQIIRAIEKKKREVLIGKKEIKAVTLKRFLPSLFWRVIKKQSAT